MSWQLASGCWIIDNFVHAYLTPQPQHFYFQPGYILTWTCSLFVVVSIMLFFSDKRTLCHVLWSEHYIWFAFSERVIFQQHFWETGWPFYEAYKKKICCPVAISSPKWIGPCRVHDPPPVHLSQWFLWHKPLIQTKWRAVVFCSQCLSRHLFAAINIQPSKVTFRR